MQHPELIILIHRSKQVDSSRHQKPMPRHLAPSQPSEMRAAIGRVLIALGTRIAPESHPAPRREPLPIAGRADI